MHTCVCVYIYIYIYIYIYTHTHTHTHTHKAGLPVYTVGNWRSNCLSIQLHIRLFCLQIERPSPLEDCRWDLEPVCMLCKRISNLNLLRIEPQSFGHSVHKRSHNMVTLNEFANDVNFLPTLHQPKG